MRMHVPTSKAGFSKLAPLDVFGRLQPQSSLWRCAIRTLLDARDLTEGVPASYLYVLVTIICAIPAFLVFRISDGMNHLFSVHDAFAVCCGCGGDGRFQQPFPVRFDSPRWRAALYTAHFADWSWALA